MTLLAPGAMLLAAALTVPPLVTFYLLKLRRRPLRVTSTMFWEQAAHDLQVNVPFRWIRPSWLLLLHALILALLLIAVGRPALEEGGAAAGRVFLLVDRSASMSARDTANGAARLERAKRLATDEIDDLTGSLEPPEVTVIAYAAEPRVLGPPSSSRATLVSMVDSITPTDQPADPAAALALVRSLTAGVSAEDSDEPGGALTVLITDGVGIDRLPSTGDPRRVIPVEPEPARTRNAGITAFSAERDVERPEVVRIFLRLVNTAPAAVSAPLLVTVDGEPASRGPVTIPAAGAGPGERVATVELEREGGGLLRVSLEHEDVLASDNAVAAVLPPVDRPPVLLVVPPARRAGDPVDARERADPFLLDVLEAIGSAGLRVIGIDRYARTDAAALDAYGVVVFDRVAPASPPPKPTLSFGARWPGLGPLEAVSAAESGRTPVLSWNRSHPVMRDVVLDTIVVADRLALPEDDADFASGSGSRTDAVPDAESGGETRAGRTARRTRRTLARGEGGPLIIEIDDAGTPRVVVGFALEQSNWPVHFSFPIFMLAAFDHLSPGATSGVWFDSGSGVTARLDRPARTIALVGPGEGGASRRIETPGNTPVTVVPLGLLDRAGVYSLVGSGGETLRTVAVNLASPVESALRPGEAVAQETPAAGTAGGGEGQLEIWRWFVLAAGALLLLEWLVYATRARA